MYLFHDSHDVTYRSPFGAVPAGSKVRLGLTVISETVPDLVSVRIWEDDVEYILEMKQKSKKGNERFYMIDLSMPAAPMLVWYYFIVRTGDAETYYTNNPDRLGGVGAVGTKPFDNSYQITVYDKRYHTPDWFKERILYQIFPDRFYGVHSSGPRPRKREEYILHTDWYEPIAFNSHPHEFGPACNDFYGGNLAGIIAKLPYLEELGVTALYLNPIFDAYSNHKYDTANYKEIDPMFGNEELFQELCAKAEERGIRIILDGVFSHTGADSVYFNKYGCYGEKKGAYRDPNSPYRSWYQFNDYPNYNSWWGCSNLPNVNEMEPGYLDYILRGEDAVVKKWLRAGASGWRLDVADELPDEFIEILRREVKSADPEAVIIGEVWEDASNKVAYDVPRKYLFGSELDSVMNYPFKDCLIPYLLGSKPAEDFNRRMMSLIENYPKETLYALMNIVGTHDTMRIKTVLGELNQDCGSTRLSSGMEDLATYRVKLASFIQMTFFGVPCIYYGDEAGMQGGSDPFNRGTYPWRAVDPELREWYRRLAGIRNSASCLRLGEFKPLLASGDIYAYTRLNPAGRDAFGRPAEYQMAVCAVNRGFEARQVELDLREYDFTEFEQGIFKTQTVRTEKGKLIFDIAPVGAELFLSINQAGA